MSNIMYTISEWYSALDSAEVNDFDPVDSGEDHGPLAAWLCEQYTHEKVNQNGEILEAVISVLEGEEHEAFSPETFLTVLLSYRGDTETSFRTLVEEHLEETYDFAHSLPGNPSEDDYRKWYLDHCRSEGEVYTGVTSGSGFFWFDTNKW